MDIRSGPMSVRQLTTAGQNHLLTNTGVWSKDGEWIFYDVRSDAAGSQFDSARIERVHVKSEITETVYQSQHGAFVGVVSCSPVEDRVVFIHGPEFPTADWSYAAWHRRGVLLDLAKVGCVTNLDGRDLVPPFTQGALRGGTHLHAFSGDGQWVSFTYEDHLLATANDRKSEPNRRNVGVTILGMPVSVPGRHERNHSGSGFSVLVSKTVASPDPGSDQIGRAYSDAWIGRDGYVRHDGVRQSKAIAMLGDVCSENGNPVAELFVLDIPDSLVSLAEQTPMAGAGEMPFTPQGIAQRRLTFTTNRPFPGLGPVRHWPRSNPEGGQIAFLMRDDQGIAQLWLIAPTGAGLRQLTHNPFPVQSAFSFRSDGRAIACIAGGSLCEVDVQSGQTTRLTKVAEGKTALRGEAVVYSPDGKQIAFVQPVSDPMHGGNEGPFFNQIFLSPSVFAG
ncbi:DUF3748 domain-containing protein [Roseimaritima multifibrata]|nr:DUF3748 domain-containing protein [Roseimaritima multifibrata]